MPTAVSLIRSEFPDSLIESAGLDALTHDRGGEREVRFYWGVRSPMLPVFKDGRIQLVRWGSKDRRGKLPCTPWSWRESVDKGAWVSLGIEVEPCVIRASWMFDGGIWFKVTVGAHGVLVRPPEGPARVYMVTEPPTRYYRVMTRSERMPRLIDEVI